MRKLAVKRMGPHPNGWWLVNGEELIKFAVSACLLVGRAMAWGIEKKNPSRGEGLSC